MIFDNLKLRIQAAGPEARRKVVIGVALLVVMAMMAVYVGFTGDKKPRVRKAGVSKKEEVTILTGKPTETISAESQEARLRVVQEQMLSIRQTVDQLKMYAARGGMKGNGQEPPDRPSGEGLGGDDAPTGDGFNPPAFKTDTPKPRAKVEDGIDPAQKLPRQKAAEERKRQLAQRKQAAKAEPDEVTPVDSTPAAPVVPPEPDGPRKIRTYSEATNKTPGKDDRAIKTANNQAASSMSVILPAGTMISGVLLTGMDAPTRQNAKNDPTPTLIRIKDLGVLPNFFRVDLRECFLVAAGYGELASERVMLRSEALSCVRDDGSLLEAPLTAYSTGEDGSAGTRGVLVQRSGPLIANSMIAGFVSGLAQLGAPQRVLPISSSSSPSGYSSPDIGQGLQGSALAGAGAAAAQLANYYTQMAQEMYPTIELKAGRSITFILNKSARLTGGQLIQTNRQNGSLIRDTVASAVSNVSNAFSPSTKSTSPNSGSKPNTNVTQASIFNTKPTAY